MRIRSSLLAGLPVLLLAACGGSDTGTGPNDQAGLRAGTYRVTFNIPLSNDTPGALIGDHEYVFRVVDPTTSRSSFTLLSSTRIGRFLNGGLTAPTTDYLDPDTRGVLTNGQEWVVRWEFRTVEGLTIEVMMTDDGSGSFTFAGCKGSRTSLDLGDGTYPGILCLVVRTD